MIGNNNWRLRLIEINLQNEFLFFNNFNARINNFFIIEYAAVSCDFAYGFLNSESRPVRPVGRDSLDHIGNR